MSSPIEPRLLAEGEDLWTLIESGAFRDGRPHLPLSNRQKKLLEKKKRSEELAKTLRIQEEKQKAQLRSMQNWTPVSRVLVLLRSTCACGQVHIYPETFITPPQPLVRYEHKANGGVWEKRLDKGDSIPGDLPTSTRILEVHSDHCTSCRGDLS